MAKKSHRLPSEEILTTIDNYRYYVRVLNKRFEDGTIGGTWVTGVDFGTKTFYFRAGEKAIEFESIGFAMDFVLQMAAKGYSAVVEIVPTWTGKMDEYLTNPKQED